MVKSNSNTCLLWNSNYNFLHFIFFLCLMDEIDDIYKDSASLCDARIMQDIITRYLESDSPKYEDFVPLFRYLKATLKVSSDDVNNMPIRHQEYIFTNYMPLITSKLLVAKENSYEIQYFFITFPAYMARIYLKLKPNRQTNATLKGFTSLFEKISTFKSQASILDHNAFYTTDYDDLKAPNIYARKNHPNLTQNHDVYQLFSMTGFFQKLILENFNPECCRELRNILRIATKYFDDTFIQYLYNKTVEKISMMTEPTYEKVMLIEILFGLYSKEEQKISISELFTDTIFQLYKVDPVKAETELYHIGDSMNTPHEIILGIFKNIEYYSQHLNDYRGVDIFIRFMRHCKKAMFADGKVNATTVNPMLFSEIYDQYERINFETLSDKRFMNESVKDYVLFKLKQNTTQKLSLEILIHVIKDTDLALFKPILEYFKNHREQVREVLRWFFDEDDHITYLQKLFAIMDVTQEQNSYETQVYLHSLVFNPNHAMTLTILQKYMWLPLKDIIEYYIKIPLKNSIFYYNLRMRKIWVDVNDNSPDGIRYIKQCFYEDPKKPIIKRCAILKLDSIIQETIDRMKGVKHLFEICQTNLEDLIDYVPGLDYSFTQPQNYLNDIKTYPNALLLTHYDVKPKIKIDINEFYSLTPAQQIYLIDCACFHSDEIVSKLNFPQNTGIDDRIVLPIYYSYLNYLKQPLDEVAEDILQFNNIISFRTFYSTHKEFISSKLLMEMVSMRSSFLSDVIEKLDFDKITNEDKLGLIDKINPDNLTSICELLRTAEGIEEPVSKKVMQLLMEKGNTVKFKLFSLIKQPYKAKLALNIIDSHMVSIDLLQNAAIAIGHNLDLLHLENDLKFDFNLKRIVSNLRLSVEDPQARTTGYYEIPTTPTVSSWLSQRTSRNKNLKFPYYIADLPSRMEIYLTGDLGKIEGSINISSAFRDFKNYHDKYFLIYYLGYENGKIVLNKGKPFYLYYGLSYKYINPIPIPNQCWGFVANEDFFEISLLMILHGYTEPFLCHCNNPDFAKYAFDKHPEIILSIDVLTYYGLMVMNLAKLYQPQKDLAEIIANEIRRTNNFYFPSQIFLVSDPSPINIVSFYCKLADSDAAQQPIFIDSLMWILADQQITKEIYDLLKSHKVFRGLLFALCDKVDDLLPVVEEDISSFSYVPINRAIKLCQLTKNEKITNEISKFYDESENFVKRVGQDFDLLSQLLMSTDQKDHEKAVEIGSMAFSSQLATVLYETMTGKSKNKTKMILSSANIINSFGRKVDHTRMGTYFFSEAARRWSFDNEFIILSKACWLCGGSATKYAVDLAMHAIERTIWSPIHELVFFYILTDPALKRSTSVPIKRFMCTFNNTAPDSSVERLVDFMMNCTDRRINDNLSDILENAPKLLKYIIPNAKNLLLQFYTAHDPGYLITFPFYSACVFASLDLPDPPSMENYVEYIEDVSKYISGEHLHFYSGNSNTNDLYRAAMKLGVDIPKVCFLEHGEKVAFHFLYYSYVCRTVPDFTYDCLQHLESGKFDEVYQRDPMVLRYFGHFVISVVEEILAQMRVRDNKTIKTACNMFMKHIDHFLNLQLEFDEVEEMLFMLYKLLNNKHTLRYMKKCDVSFVPYTKLLVNYKPGPYGFFHLELIKLLMSNFQKVVDVDSLKEIALKVMDPTNPYYNNHLYLLNVYLRAAKLDHIADNLKPFLSTDLNDLFYRKRLNREQPNP